MEQPRTFVLWISRETAGEAALEGRFEDVETGRQVRFRSAVELVAFLREACVSEENCDEQAV